MRPVGIILALAACNENQFGISNGRPEVTITSHLQGDPVVEGIPFVVRAVGSDVDSPAEDLVGSWFVAGSLQAACTRVPLTADGTTECTVSLLSDERPWRVQVEVRDPKGSVGTYAVDLEVVPQQEGYGAPTVEIVTPGTGSSSNQGDALTFEGWVSDAADAATSIAVEWSSDQDGVLSTVGADSSGTSLFVGTLSPGDHVLTLKGTDTEGNFATDVVTHHVNGVPTAPVVSITPSSPSSSADLQVVIGTPSTDPEGTPVTYTYEWLKNGVTDPTQTSALVLGSATARGETWTVRVTPHDDAAAGPPGEAAVTVQNAPPAVTSVVLGPEPAATNDVLTAAVTTADDDGDVVSVRYEWRVDGVVVAGTAPSLDGASAFDRDQLVQVLVTANDGSADSAAVGSNVVTIANTPPTAPVVSIAPTTPIEQVDDLVCSVVVAATDADGDPVTHVVEWDVDGASYPRGGDAGPSTTTLADDTADGGDTLDAEEWTCSVAATDGTATGLPATDTVTIGSVAFVPDYDGTFDIVPNVAYACAGGLVGVNVGQLTFSDAANTLTVSGGPTPMRQTPTPTDENFSAAGSIFGGCTETYTISGSFQDQDHFVGQLTASFNGWQCGLTNCTNQVWPIDGYRL